MFEPDDLQPESWMISAGRSHEAREPLNTPVVLATSYAKGVDERGSSVQTTAGDSDRSYIRQDGSATWEAFEHIIGGLELGKAVAFSSGMAAASAVFDLLPVGAQVALPSDCYHGVMRLAENLQTLGRISITCIDVGDTAAWLATGQSMDLVWLESPTNPLLVVADLPAILNGARKAGCLTVVDNTFATPLIQQPLTLGADIVVHSATKLLGGHSDLLAGVAVTSHETSLQALRDMRTLHGATPGALEMYLATRGMRTLALRLEKAQANALILAERLMEHSNVRCVRYPGLSDHPTHTIAARTMRGFGTMISFDVGWRGTNDQGAGSRDGDDVHDATCAAAVCNELQLIRRATSLGGVESTIERRGALAGQEHLSPSLLRLSVGCEHVEDLWRDLKQALDALAF